MSRELEEQKALDEGYNYLIEDREAGIIIDWARTEEEAEKIIENLEKEDAEIERDFNLQHEENLYKIYNIVN